MSLPDYNPVGPTRSVNFVRLFADDQHACLDLLLPVPNLPRLHPNTKLRHESDDEYALQQTPEKESN